MELAHVRLMMKQKNQWHDLRARLVQYRKAQHRDIFRTPLSISSSSPRSHQSSLIQCAAIPPSNAISQLLHQASFFSFFLCPKLHLQCNVEKSRAAATTATYLVESLQQAQDAALDLLLVQASTSAVHPHAHEALDADGRSDGARSSHQGRCSDGGGSGNSGADGRGGCAEDGSAEHVGRLGALRRKKEEEEEEKVKKSIDKFDCCGRRSGCGLKGWLVGVFFG